MARDFLYCEETDTKIYPNDIVSISTYPNIKWIAKRGWYKIDTIQKNGWYFVSIADKTIIPADQVDITAVTKDVEQGTSEYRPTLKDTDTTPAEINYIVIPGTNIRLYDSDIVKISNKPRVKWIVHSGWFIYDNVQNFGWYFESIKTGEILPVSIIDLSLCTLVETKTQGSNRYDGKVVNYTRPFTDNDAEVLNRTFITLDTLEQRNNLDINKLINGRIVRVNDVGGAPAYYIWNAETREWEVIDQDQGIPELVGTATNPIILSRLEQGLYRVKGVYLVSPTSDTSINTNIDHIVFVSGDDVIEIKVITENSVIDYQVEDDYVILVNSYATETYVNNKIFIVQEQISEIIQELTDVVKKSKDSGATFTQGQWAVFDSSGNIKGLDAAAANVSYTAPQSGPTSQATTVQAAIDALNNASTDNILYDTEENWNSQIQLIAQRGVIYVYSDHAIYQDKEIPGIKIGDGSSYLIDMPFIDDKYAAHVLDTIIHVSTDDRDYWGDKVTCNIDPLNRNILVFTKEY